MKRLLNIEILKNFHYKPFKILVSLYFILLIGLLFIGLVDFDVLGIRFNLKEQGIYEFPFTWNFITYIVGFFKIFLGMIIVFSIAQEFSNRMYKQNIIDGLSRKEFIFSKLITISLFTLISTTFVSVITFILGYLYSKNISMKAIFSEIYFIPNYALELFTFFSFLLFLSILLRKSMFVILSLFFWGFVENILSLVAKFFYNTNDKIISGTHSFYITDLLPYNSVSNLIPNPIHRLNVTQSFLMTDTTIEYPYISVISCIIWSILFIFGAYKLLKSRDI